MPLKLPLPSPCRVLLAGDGAMALALLEGLLAFGPDIEIIGVLRWHLRKKKPWQESIWPYLPPGAEPIEKVYRETIHHHRLHEIRAIGGLNHDKFRRTLDRLRPHVVLVGSWGEIIRKKTLIHRWGEEPITFINCHPSLLPAYRGANPYLATITHGETQTGITFHQMDTGIDTGPILVQRAVTINPHDTGGHVRDRCAQAAQEAIQPLFHGLLGQSDTPLVPRPQSGSSTDYAGKIDPQDSIIDWSQDPQAIYDRWRALQPWLDSMTFWEGRLPLIVKSLMVQKSRPIRPSSSEPLAPGTLIGQRQGQLIVATTDPDTRIILTNYRLYYGFFPQPVFLSRLLLLPRIQPGQKFTAQWSNPTW